MTGLTLNCWNELTPEERECELMDLIGDLRHWRKLAIDRLMYADLAKDRRQWTRSEVEELESAEAHFEDIEARLQSALRLQESIDDDPTPWCNYCGAKTRERCKCGPIAEND